MRSDPGGYSFAVLASQPDSRRQCLEFELWLNARSCEEVGEHEWGRAFLTPSLSLAAGSPSRSCRPPRLLYAKLGFEPIGELHLLRQPAP